MSSNTISILITGSNQGLGYEAALQLSKHAHVHLIISGRNASRVEEALVKIKKDAGCQAKVQSVVIDVSDDGSIQAAVAEVEKLLDGKPLDVLVVRIYTALLQAVARMSDSSISLLFERTTPGSTWA